MNHDPVNHPKHYTSHPSGIEVIEITEHMSFALGSAVKYILRSPYKGNEIQDLEKAIWMIKREIARLYEYGPYKKPHSDEGEDNPTLPFLDTTIEKPGKI
jgi:hypothetical protein